MHVEVHAGADREWDDFVRSRSGWTPYHLAGWRRILEEVHGLETTYLVARDDRQTSRRIRAVLPLVHVRSSLFGRYLVSMPFVNYGGPLGDTEGIRAVVDEAAGRADAQGFELLELRSRSELPLSLPVSRRKVCVGLSLPSDGPEALWLDLKSKVRSQVRRPRKEGVEVRFGRDQLDDFYRVYSLHMRDLGTPAQPRQLFEEVAWTFPAHVWVGCARYRGNAVAGGFGFAWEGTFEMTWAADLMAYRKMAPNMALYWGFMERSCREGLTHFDFGRCTPGSGSHRFKLQWGGEDDPLHWYQWSSGRRAATPSPDDSAWSWGPEIWKLLPVRITRALGPRLVRHLP